MRCLYCGKKLSLLHKISGKEFCGSEHYELYLQDQESLGLARLIEARKAARSRQRSRQKPPGGGPPLADSFFAVPPASRDCPLRIRACYVQPQPTLGVALPQAGMSLGACRLPRSEPVLEIRAPAAEGGRRRLEPAFQPPRMRAHIPGHTPNLDGRSPNPAAPGWAPVALPAPASPEIRNVPGAEPLPPPPGLTEPPASPSQHFAPASPEPVPLPLGGQRPGLQPPSAPPAADFASAEPETPGAPKAVPWSLVQGGWKILQRIQAGFVPDRIAGLAAVRPAQAPPSYPAELAPLPPVTAADFTPLPPCRLPSRGALAGRLYESRDDGPALPATGPLAACSGGVAAPAMPPAPCEPSLPAGGLRAAPRAAVPGPATPAVRKPKQLPSKAFLVPPTIAPRLVPGLAEGRPLPVFRDAEPQPRPASEAPSPLPSPGLSVTLPEGASGALGLRLAALAPEAALPWRAGPAAEAPRGSASAAPAPMSAGAEVPEYPARIPLSLEAAAGAVCVLGARLEVPDAAPPAPEPQALPLEGGAAMALPGPIPGPRPWAGRQPGLLPLGIAHIVPPSGQGLQAFRGEWAGTPPKPLLRRPSRVPATEDFKPHAVPETRRRRPGIELGPRLRRAWKRVPEKARWAVMSLPLALLLVQQIDFTAERPAETAAAPPEAQQQQQESSFAEFLEARWENLRTNIRNRAAISLTDDFRSGLGYWRGDENWGRTWSYDNAGFIVPGALALYEPSLNLVDYEFILAARIEKGGVSWVFRARDTKSYYAGRLVITQPGPLPKARLINYTVIDGRRRSQKSTEVPFPLRDKMYEIRVTVRGSTFTTYLDDRLVGLYKDATLKAGGVGLFRARGEKSRVRWISVMHQYDLVGRLCALIAPYNLERPPGGWSE